MLYLWLFGITVIVVAVLYFTSSKESSKYDTKVYDPIEERLRNNDLKNDRTPPMEK